MVWYVLLQPLRPELNGQDPFQIRKTPTFFLQPLFYRGTKDFEISVSTTNLAMNDVNWIVYASGTMAQCNGCVTPYTVTGPKIRARNVKFLIKSYHGRAGGLNYFQPNSEETEFCL
jgi:hypothetical protein